MEANPLIEKEELYLQQIKQYLNLKDYKILSITIKEKVKEMCVAKLCYVLGISRICNYKNGFFEFFSCVVGEAVCEHLGIRTHVAEECVRFVRYEGVNFVSKCKQFLIMEEIDEAVLDCFNFLDKHKNLVLKKV